MFNKLYIVILFALGLLLSNNACSANQMVIITKNYSDIKIEKIELPANTQKLTLQTGKYESISKIEGIEQLKKLKYLYIGYGIEDFSFLDKMTNLEILAIEGYNAFLNLNFIQEMQKIRILYLTGIYLETTTIDFSNNKNLEYIFLGNIYWKEHANFYEINPVNIPNSLKCIYIFSIYTIINETLLEKIIKVPLILVKGEVKSIRGDRFIVSDEYLDAHPNIQTEGIINKVPKEISQKYIRDFFLSEENP